MWCGQALGTTILSVSVSCACGIALELGLGWVFFFQPSNLYAPHQPLKSLPLLSVENDDLAMVGSILEEVQTHICHQENFHLVFLVNKDGFS